MADSVVLITNTYLNREVVNPVTSGTMVAGESKVSRAINAVKTGNGNTNGNYTASISGITEYYDGLTIKVRLETAPHAIANTLNLNSLGARIICYKKNEVFSNQFERYSELMLTYRTDAHSGYTPTSSFGALVANTTYTAGWVVDSSYGQGSQGGSYVGLTGDETVGGIKTFSDGIVVADSSKIMYGASSTPSSSSLYVSIDYVAGSDTIDGIQLPSGVEAGIIRFSGVTLTTTPQVVAFVFDSQGATGITETTSQHNYITNFSKDGNWIEWPTSTTYTSGIERKFIMSTDSSSLFSHNLTFRTSSVSPGNGQYSATFTGNGLTSVPPFFCTLLQSQVNNESYQRVACVMQATTGQTTDKRAYRFNSSTITDISSNVTVSYNNGLVINAGSNYMHGGGNYVLHYLTSDDLTSSSGSGSVTPAFTSLTQELATKYEKPSGGIPANDLAIGVIPTICTDISLNEGNDYMTTSPSAVYKAAHPTTGSSYTNMAPNKFYILGQLTGTVSITLATPTDQTIENEYKFQFSTGSSVPTVNWPNGTAWMGGVSPTLKANKTYQVSILNGLAVIGEF